MRQYTYTAYGLTVESAFPLPELRPTAGGLADLTIKYGDVPHSLPDPAPNGIAWQMAPGRLLLSVEQVARYLVVENREIRVQPLAGTSDADVRLFLLGSVFAAVLHARQFLLLHASVVRTDHGAVLLMGRSGSGKSTLLAAFLQRGYSMMADDKACIVQTEDGALQAMPGFPLIRLTDVAVKGLQFPTTSGSLHPASKKYSLAVAQFHPGPLPVRAAYSLNAHNRHHIALAALSAVDRFEELNQHTYRRRFLHLAEQRQAHFRLLAAVATGARVSRVLRPDDPTLIGELADRLEEDLAR